MVVTERPGDYYARVRLVPISAPADCETGVSAAIENATNRAIASVEHERDSDGVIWLGHGEIQRRTAR